MYIPCINNIERLILMSDGYMIEIVAWFFVCCIRRWERTMTTWVCTHELLSVLGHMREWTMATCVCIPELINVLGHMMALHIRHHQLICVSSIYSHGPSEVTHEWLIIWLVHYGATYHLTLPHVMSGAAMMARTNVA